MSSIQDIRFNIPAGPETGHMSSNTHHPNPNMTHVGLLVRYAQGRGCEINFHPRRK